MTLCGWLPSGKCPKYLVSNSWGFSVDELQPLLKKQTCGHSRLATPNPVTELNFTLLIELHPVSPTRSFHMVSNYMCICRFGKKEEAPGSPYQPFFCSICHLAEKSCLCRLTGRHWLRALLCYMSWLMINDHHQTFESDCVRSGEKSAPQSVSLKFMQIVMRLTCFVSEI